MTVTLHFIRYHVWDKAECDDVDDAVRQAFWMVERNTAAPDRIEQNGKVLMDRGQIDARQRELGLD